MIGRASASVIAAGSSKASRPWAADEGNRELVADVDDVGAQGAGRERAVPHLLEPLLPLPEVDGHRDDLGAIGIGQPGDGDGRIEPARLCQHHALDAVGSVGHSAA